MATYPTPLATQNKKQLRHIARNRRVAYDNNTTKAALITAITG